jgi:hypothetical protein
MTDHHDNYGVYMNEGCMVINDGEVMSKAVP